MIVGCNLPSNISWVASGAGTFSTDVRISSMNPGEVTRITHPGGSPSQLLLQGQWSVAQSIGLVMVVGLAYLTPSGSPTAYTWAPVPAGVSVTLTGKRFGDAGFPYALGGNSATATTYSLPNGTTGVFFMLGAGLSNLVGVQLAIELDWLTATSELEVGGIYPFTTVEVPGAPGWQQSWKDPTLKERTLAGQLHRVVRQSWREYDINIPAGVEADVRGEGLDNSFDYEKLANALRYSRLCAVVPYHRTFSTGVFDADALHRTGMVGTASPKALTHVERRYFSHGYVFEEIPSLEELS